jgi:hypothetical protein
MNWMKRISLAASALIALGAPLGAQTAPDASSLLVIWHFRPQFRRRCRSPRTNSVFDPGKHGKPGLCADF